MSEFRISVDLKQLAADLNKTVEDIYSRVHSEVELLSVSTHAFIVNKAQSELSGYMLQAYLGKDGKNVRWIKVSNNMWCVEVSQEAAWLESGRPEVFMGLWLLKPGAKGVKTSKKDGSLYRAIPMTQAKFTGGAFKNPNPAYETMIKSVLRENKISLKKIERDEHGNPRLGVLHKINMEPPGPQSQYPEMFSKPRTAEMAAKTGLAEHGGIYHLKGLAVTQRMNERGKVTREAITFRTISSKHAAEGRWMAHEVKPFGGIEAAHTWAKQEWVRILSGLEREFNNS